MKRVNILWLLLNSLFLIVFNMLFFLLGNAGNTKTSVWISYGFIHFAYFLFLATPLLVRKGKADYIYGRALYPITTAYFIVELITGVTLILIAPETVKVTIIVQVVLAAAFIGWLLVYLIADEHTAKNVEQHKAELQYVKQSSSQLKAIMQQIADKSTSKKVEQVYDLIHSSQVKSDGSVRPVEEEIISEINNLECVVEQNNLEQTVILADKIYKLADKRNRQLKLLN